MAIFSAACAPAEAGAVELTCIVDGAQYVGSSGEICSAFKQKIDAALEVPTRQAKTFVVNGRSDAIAIDIRVLKRGGVVAKVKQRKNGSLQNFPEIAVDVMDRPLAMRDVETLANEVARLFVQPT
jgi:hypothetical protein